MSFVFMYVFFFKQKTAYEMRISDWSSDVCSSDLSSLSGYDLAKLLSHADKALYRSKREGRNRVTVFDRDAQAWKQLQVVAGGNGDPGTAPGGSPEKVVPDADSERLIS